MNHHSLAARLLFLNFPPNLAALFRGSETFVSAHFSAPKPSDGADEGSAGRSDGAAAAAEAEAAAFAAMTPSQLF